MVLSLLIALMVAVVLGGAAHAYLWRVDRHRLEAVAGIHVVAGMRWREYSKLVVDALRARGFEPDPQSNAVERGQQADIVLRRAGKDWLLACRQGMQYRITPQVLAEFSRSLRAQGATDGLIATPGRVDADARKQAGAVELIDGAALWPLLKPWLPVSVRDSVASESDALAKRYILLAWLVALALGAGAALLLPAHVERLVAATPAAVVNRPTPGTGTRAGTGTGTDQTASPVPALAAAPLSDEEQRESVRREVSDLAGIDRALWSTRSTLLVYRDSDSDTDPLPSICSVLERYDELRASRLQLQPAPGSQRTVRFLQCRLY